MHHCSYHPSYVAALFHPSYVAALFLSSWLRGKVCVNACVKGCVNAQLLSCSLYPGCFGIPGLAVQHISRLFTTCINKCLFVWWRHQSFMDSANQIARDKIPLESQLTTRWHTHTRRCKKRKDTSVSRDKLKFVDDAWIVRWRKTANVCILSYAVLAFHLSFKQHFVLFFTSLLFACIFVQTAPETL